MSQAKKGDTVKVHYTGKLDNGEVFATSKNRQPLECVVGGGTLLAGIEKGIIGMEIGVSKTIEIPLEEAFGYRHEELVVAVMHSEFPDYITPKIGQRLQIRRPDSSVITVTVTDLDEDTIRSMRTTLWPGTHCYSISNWLRSHKTSISSDCINLTSILGDPLFKDLLLIALAIGRRRLSKAHPLNRTPT